METKIENAVIRSTRLGFEDHGIFTCEIFLDRQLGSQGFGGYGLDLKGTDYGLKFIQKVLDTVGVETWEELKGKHVRIRVGKSWGAKIEAIGNFMQDYWFDPEEFSKPYREKKNV